MIQELIKIGDEVELSVDKESREWGYNPYPNGTKGVVIGFTEIDYGWANGFGKRPGIYENRCSVRIGIDDDREITEYSSRLELLDREEYNRRIIAARNERGCIPTRDVWLRELPHTDYIEGDKVTSLANFALRSENAVISEVHYGYIGQFCNDGITPMGIYSVSDKWPSGCNRFVSWDEQQHIRLVERGWVWKHHHGEKIDFPDLETKARFYKSLGLCDEVRNPKLDLYLWTIEEAVDAIHSGMGHAISVGNGLFGSTPRVAVYLFRDLELGEEIRKLTMQGFPRKTRGA